MPHKSYIQTVEVTFPSSTNVFLTIRTAPPRIDFGDCNTARVQYDDYDKKTTIWEPDGTIRVKYETGRTEVYHPKPTINDVILGNFGAPRQYYRIHTDGSVEHGFGGQYYYWGPEEDVEWNMSGIGVCVCEECVGDYETDYEDYIEYDTDIVYKQYKFIMSRTWKTD